MQSSLDYAGFAQLCERSATMRAYYRIIPRCLDNKLHSLLVILLVCLVIHNKSWRRCDMETVPVSLSVELTVSQLFCEWHNYALVQRITVATTAVDRKCIDFVFLMMSGDVFWRRRWLPHCHWLWQSRCQLLLIYLSARFVIMSLEQNQCNNVTYIL